MINPVIPYAIRGAIWYQGESIVGGDAGRRLYPLVQSTLIADWRWLIDRNDTPWYPTMRLFRQDAGRQWQPVIAAIVEAVRERVAAAT